MPSSAQGAYMNASITNFSNFMGQNIYSHVQRKNIKSVNEDASETNAFTSTFLSGKNKSSRMLSVKPKTRA